MSKRKKKHGKVYNNKAFLEGWDRIFGGVERPSLQQLADAAYAGVTAQRKPPDASTFKPLKNPRFEDSKTFEAATVADFDTVSLVDGEDTHLEVKASHGKG